MTVLGWIGFHEVLVDGDGLDSREEAKQGWGGE